MSVASDRWRNSICSWIACSTDCKAKKTPGGSTNCFVLKPDACRRYVGYVEVHGRLSLGDGKANAQCGMTNDQSPAEAPGQRSADRSFIIHHSSFIIFDASFPASRQRTALLCLCGIAPGDGRARGGGLANAGRAHSYVSGPPASSRVRQHHIDSVRWHRLGVYGPYHANGRLPMGQSEHRFPGCGGRQQSQSGLGAAGNHLSERRPGSASGAGDVQVGHGERRNAHARQGDRPDGGDGEERQPPVVSDPHALADADRPRGRGVRRRRREHRDHHRTRSPRHDRFSKAA